MCSFGDCEVIKMYTIVVTVYLNDLSKSYINNTCTYTAQIISDNIDNMQIRQTDIISICNYAV